jgi:diguanylate cyclase (GGDEF)-like protein/PAS domain S-box-containing protein
MLSRMSLEQRLLTTLALLLLTLFLGTGAVQLHQQRAEALRALATEQARVALLLSHALADLAVLQDYTAIKQALQIRIQQGDLLQVSFRWDGVQVAADRPVPPVQAPAWFRHWLSLQMEPSTAAIVLGGEPYGTVQAVLATDAWALRLWQQTQQLLTSLLLGLVLLWWLVRCLVQGNLYGLRMLHQAAQVFTQTGRWPVITLVPGTAPEVVASADTLNQMGRQVGELLARLAEEEERWRVTLASIEDGVIVTDLAGQMVFMNPAATRLTGWVHPVRGVAVTTAFKLEGGLCPMQAALDTSTQQAFPQGWLTRVDGTQIAVRGTASPIRHSEGVIIGAVAIFHDETERRQLVQELHTLAFQDPLTGLPNRRGLESRLECAVRDAQEQGRQHVFCYIDLDQFKLVNDLCGHPAGDKLLREIAQLMRAEIPPEHFLGRLGGDEFGLLLIDADLAVAQGIGQKILTSLQAFRYWHDAQHVFKIGASIGITRIQADTQGSSEVMSQADKACYLAKTEGRNRVQVYQVQTNLVQMEDEMHWVNVLQQALDGGRLILFRQAVVAVATPKQFEHYEILIRLRTPEGELQSPARFLPAAERYGLAPAIDRYVVQTLLRYLAKHPEDLSSYAVNLSGRTLAEPDFLEFVVAQLAQHHLAAARLSFEITETAAINDLQTAGHMIAGLRQLGCRFFLDDFGSGMSSFAYLKQLPVDYLKIDGGFIRNMLTDSDDYVIVNAVAQIARDLRRQTVAEYVENDALLVRLREIGVDYAQGYAIHEPEPLPISIQIPKG